MVVGDLALSSSKTVDSVTTSYTYDAIDQLLTESRTGYSATYTYDANGTRVTKALGGTTETYVCDDADKLTSISVGGSTVKSFGYDAAGRTTSMSEPGSTTTYSYDYEDRLAGIGYPEGGSGSYSYNELDTRVGRTGGEGTKTYRRDGVGATAPVLSDGSRTYTPGISSRASSASTFDVLDYLGSTTRQTNSSQSTTATRAFDAFGNFLSGTGSPVGPFGFAGAWGYQEDADSGLQLLGHRYYDPSIGRFLTRDPVKDGRNWYRYCENNPTKQVDPLGLQAEKLPLARPLPPGWQVIEGGVAEGGVTGLAAAGPLLPCLVAAGVGWALGDWLDKSVGISDYLGPRIAGWTGEEPAEPWIPLEWAKKKRKKGEHTSNKRPSTRQKHEDGQARGSRDRNRGEKGDKRRPCVLPWLGEQKKRKKQWWELS